MDSKLPIFLDSVIFFNYSEKPKICISRSFSTEAISLPRASSRVLSNSIHVSCRLSEVGADDDRRAALRSRYGHHHELLPHLHLRQFDFRRCQQVRAAHPPSPHERPEPAELAVAELRDEQSVPLRHVQQAVHRDGQHAERKQSLRALQRQHRRRFGARRNLQPVRRGGDDLADVVRPAEAGRRSGERAERADGGVDHVGRKEGSEE